MHEIHGLRPTLPTGPQDGPRPLAGPSFSSTLGALVQSAAARGAEAEVQVDRFVTGGPGELHETTIAASKAEISFRLMMSVRNRLLETYREVMRMGM